MTPHQKEQPEAWEKAEKIGRDVKATRDKSEGWLSAGQHGAPARSMASEPWSAAASVRGPVDEPEDMWKQPVEKKSRKDRMRRRDDSSSSSVGRRKSRRHNVTINFR